MRAYTLKGRTLEGSILGKPILQFSDELTENAVKRIANKIACMDAMYKAVENLLSDGHIKSVVENSEKLQRIYSQYRTSQYEAERSA